MEDKKTNFFILFFLNIFFIFGNASSIEKIIISNERGNSLSILSKDGEFIDEISSCGRPRGMHFSEDKKSFFVACADDNLILIYNTQTIEVEGRITNVFAPETFDLHPNGEILIVSNEEDATATVWNWVTGEFLDEFETGEEPEGVQVTNDGVRAFVASEVADIVHVLNLNTKKVEFDIPVDRRPRRFALSPNGEKLFVSAELASVLNVIDTKTLSISDTITFLPTGFKKEQVTPVDVLLNKSGDIGYVALGRANHVGVFNPKNGKVIDYILVGKRAWGLALSEDEKWLYVTNGLSDDLSIVNTEKRKVIRSVKVGSVPYGVLIVE